MHLFFLLFFLLIVSSLVRYSILSELQSVAQSTHFFCIDNLPAQSKSLAELKALVCAESFSTLGESQVYISTGLIHLFVVSGAHLIFIENFIPKIWPDIKLNRWILFSILFLYGLACNLNPPIVRCLVATALNFYLSEKNIIWPAHMRILAVGLFTISLNYNWISSLSLQMSWLAAFAVSLGLYFYSEKSALLKQSLFYFFLLPTLLFFQIPSPSVILMNIILTPLLEFILFPLALLVWFFNSLYPLFDFLIICFKSILGLLASDSRPQTVAMPEYLVLLNWSLILLLHFIYHLVHVRQQRKPQHVPLI